jgi:hypothetical protein
VSRAGKQAGNERRRTRRAMFGAGIPALAMAAVAVAAGACTSSTPSSSGTNPSHKPTVSTTKPNPTTSPSIPVTTPTTVAPPPPLVLETAVVKASRSGSKAYTVSCDYPLLSGSSNTTAVASINAAIQAEVSAQVKSFEEDANQGPLSHFVPTAWQLTSTWSKVWLSPELGSVSMTLTDYPAGAAHPISTVVTFNFDPSTGRLYALGDLFQAGSDWLQVLSHESVSLLPSAIGPGGSSIIIDTDISPLASNFAAFTMTPAELSITFQDNQVGPYAIGTPTVHIPQSALSAVVNPEGPLN